MSTEAFARTEARYLMRMDGVVFGNDLYNSRSIQTLFHQQNLDVSDVEHYNMAFPAFADGLGLGPSVLNNGEITTPGTMATGITSANVLPFGPVNLAFPSIQEDSLQTLSATQTGFFASNYNYRPEADYGNVPLSPAYPYALRHAICPAPLFGGLSLYPEQYDTWWVNNRQKELNKSAQAAKPPANQTATNQTSKNQTATNQTSSASSTGEEAGIPLNELVSNSTVTSQIKTPDLKPTLAISYFKPRNASSKPWDMPIVYPWVYDLAGRDYPVFPNPGIGTFSTNGAGSTGARLTGPLPTAKPAGTTANRTSTQARAGNQTAGNKTVGNMTAGNMTVKNQTKMGNATGSRIIPPVTQPAGSTTISPAGTALTYADYNFDASTEQISQMSILERMWRNSHRGGQMGKAYIGDTSAPYWIDPYDRPYDLPMIDEHFYVLQSALNMVVPGTQIMPRFWSLGYL